MDIPKNKLKTALANGELQIGLWSALCSNIVAEVLADSGFDWIVLDTEHSPNDPLSLVSQMQAMKGGTASLIVRPAWNDPVLIKRILDSGAQSLIVPYVQNADEAKAAVSAIRYPPEGIRGVAGVTRASNYGRVTDYLNKAGDEIALIVQVETGEALQQIDEIAAVPGVDAVFIGPADLSASLGHLGNPHHEDVQSALKLAIDKLKTANKPGGILSLNAQDTKRYIEWGYRFVGVGIDVDVLRNATDALAGQFKA